MHVYGLYCTVLGSSYICTPCQCLRYGYIGVYSKGLSCLEDSRTIHGRVANYSQVIRGLRPTIYFY